MSSNLAPERATDLDALRRRVELVDRARAALDLVTTEDEAIHTATAAVAELVPARSIRIVHDGPCVALRRQGPTVTTSSGHFDACPHLQGQPSPVSGVCVSLSFSEEIIGALQWEGDVGFVPDRITRGAIDVVAHLLALRLVLLRSDLGAEDPRTDPLTGALNRRSTGRAIRDLIRDLVPFSLAVCDLDGFDGYNEAHGHDVGDRALRLFAETISATVRPGDVVGRTAGDTFTVVFPATSAIDAAQALERVREVLVLALTGGELPSFTASFGVADSNQGDSVDAIIETADLAAGLAKRSGANRVVVAGEETSGPTSRDIASDQDGRGL